MVQRPRKAGQSGPLTRAQKQLPAGQMVHTVPGDIAGIEIAHVDGLDSETGISDAPCDSLKSVEPDMVGLSEKTLHILGRRYREIVVRIACPPELHDQHAGPSWRQDQDHLAEYGTVVRNMFEDVRTHDEIEGLFWGGELSDVGDLHGHGLKIAAPIARESP